MAPGAMAAVLATTIAACGDSGREDLAARLRSEQRFTAAQVACIVRYAERNLGEQAVADLAESGVQGLAPEAKAPFAQLLVGCVAGTPGG